MQRSDGAAGQRENTGPAGKGELSGIEALRADAMMARLMEALEEKKDIGHYGRLVFITVARHFISEEELLGWLTHDGDCDAHMASFLVDQVNGHNYDPPTRERILEWQQLQEFQLIPNPDDPSDRDRRFAGSASTAVQKSSAVTIREVA